MEVLPRSVRLAAWTNAWLRGQTSVDEVLDRVRGADDEPHDVEGMPPGAPAPLGDALRALRALGAHAATVALPRAGDPHGLAGPRVFTEAAVEAGEAVLTLGAPHALVPRVTTFGPPGDQGHLVSWVWHPATPAPPTADAATADRELSTALLEANSTLTDLDLPSWRPEVAQLLEDVRAAKNAAPLPHGYSPQAQALAARAARLWAIADFALADHGAAVSAAAADARRAALQPLERAARHALAAACNSLATAAPPTSS
ncbi:MAG TPA: hypothetical protein VK925_05720 [Jiangellaceae bacterium]|nr:hypothetical protein [Jiangellaceae bacterium]